MILASLTTPSQRRLATLVAALLVVSLVSQHERLKLLQGTRATEEESLECFTKYIDSWSDLHSANLGKRAYVIIQEDDGMTISSISIIVLSCICPLDICRSQSHVVKLA